MPADIRHQGYSPKRSMLLVWENDDADSAQALRERRTEAVSGAISSPDIARSVAEQLRRAAGMSKVRWKLIRQLQTQLFIGGRFVAAEAAADIEVLNPHDNSVIAEVAEARRADIDRAVAAATKAVPGLERASRRPTAAACCSSSPTRSKRTPTNSRSSNRSTPAIRSAIRAISTCRAPPRRSATSAAWPTSSRAP